MHVIFQIFLAFENLTKEKTEQQVVNKQMEEKLQAANKGKDSKRI